MKKEIAVYALMFIALLSCAVLAQVTPDRQKTLDRKAQLQKNHAILLSQHQIRLNAIDKLQKELRTIESYLWRTERDLAAVDKTLAAMDDRDDTLELTTATATLELPDPTSTGTVTISVLTSGTAATTATN